MLKLGTQSLIVLLHGADVIMVGVNWSSWLLFCMHRLQDLIETESLGLKALFLKASISCMHFHFKNKQTNKNHGKQCPEFNPEIKSSGYRILLSMSDSNLYLPSLRNITLTPEHLASMGQAQFTHHCETGPEYN